MTTTHASTGDRPVETNDYAGYSRERQPISKIRFWIGVLLLGVAVGCTVSLVSSHFNVINLPGCGRGGGCAAAAASKWGKLPIGDWASVLVKKIGMQNSWGEFPIGELEIPVSFLGCAYFTGLFIAWWTCRSGVPMLFLMFLRLGVLASTFFIAIIFTKDLVCMYCLGAHISNIAFWLLVETARPKRSRSWKPIGALVTVFALGMTGLLVADARAEAAFQQTQDKELAESVDEIIRQNQEKARIAEERRLAEEKAKQVQLAMASPDKDEVGGNGGNQADKKPWKGGFTGRYLLGPDKAKVRIVMITDYQCPDCFRIEGEVMEYVKANKQVSLSIKHFPMCADCNPNFKDHNMHPNACWSARAAETAGLLGGNQDFWTMHDWLFEHKGVFDAQQLRDQVAAMGFDQNNFFKEMQGQTTLDLVKSDIDEAIWLGLHFTPMVFINGYEVKGVFGKNAVVRAAQQVLATDPPRMNADLDQPPPGSTKVVEDWYTQAARPMPANNTAWPMGPENARVKIDLYADYQEPWSAKCDKEIREWMKGKTEAHYEFRHFPVDEACNDVTTRTIFDKSCIAHRAAVAAGLLGGSDAFWKMHAALYDNQDKLSMEFVTNEAKKIGLDVDTFKSKFGSDEVKAVIMEDATGCKRTKEARNSLLYRGGIPTIYINGKVVPRWRLGDDVLMKDILDKAYEKN